MNCFSNGLNVSDSINKLTEDISADLYNNIKGSTSIGARLFSEDFAEEFIKEVKDNKGDEYRLSMLELLNTVNENWENIIRNGNIEEKDALFSKIIEDELSGRPFMLDVLKNSIVEHYPSISYTVKDSSNIGLDGFTTGEAKKLSYENFGNILTRRYYENSIKSDAEKREIKQLIDDTVNEVLDNFYKSILTPRVLRSSIADGDKHKAFIGAQNKLNNVKVERASIAEQLNKDRAELKKLQNTISRRKGKNKVKEEERPILAKLNNNIAQLKLRLSNNTIELVNANNDLFAKALSLTEELIGKSGNRKTYANTILNNYFNFVKLVRDPVKSAEFIKNALNTAAFKPLLKYFSGTINEDNFEGYRPTTYTEDEALIPVEDKDETTKAWRDAAPRTFDELMKESNRLYLSTLPRLNTPMSQPYTENAKPDYDTNNVLGVNRYMDYNTVVRSITERCILRTPEDFLNSIKNMSTNVGLQGLSKIYFDCLNDRNLLMSLYSQFGNMVYEKLNINIANVNKTTVSNPNINSETKNFFIFRDQIRYSSHLGIDSQVENVVYKYSNIRDIKNEFKKGVPSVQFIRLIDDVKYVIKSLIPSFDSDIIDSYFNAFDINSKNESIRSKNIDTISTTVAGIMNEFKTIIQALSNIYELQDERWKEKGFIFEQSKNSNTINVFDDTKQEELNNQLLDRIAKVTELEETIRQKLKDIDTPIYQLTKKLTAIMPTSAEYTSLTVNNTKMSDVIHNSWIGRFNQTMKEATGAAQDNLLNLFAIGGEEMAGSNQFAYHPIIKGFGEGANRVDGLVIKTPIAGEDRDAINEVMSKVLKIDMYNGNDTGFAPTNVDYETMGNADYLITRFFMFSNTPEDYGTTEIRKGVAGRPLAYYFMRVPSDAPHNYALRYLRLTKEQVKESLTMHALQQFNDFVAQLNNIIDNAASPDGSNRLYLKTDTRGLFDNYHFAKTGEGENRGDLVDEKGRLTGNIFNFGMFFDMGDNSFRERLFKDLSIYGNDSHLNDFIIKDDSTGRWYINGDHYLFKNGVIHTDTVDRQNRYLKFNPDVLFSSSELIARHDNGEINKSSFKIREYLRDAVDKWTEDYIIEMKNTLKNELELLKEVLEDKPYLNAGDNIDADIEDFLLNDVNMNMNMDMLFEGNSAFYKDAQTFLKRTKQDQGGGSTYYGGSIFSEEFGTIEPITIGDKNNQQTEVITIFKGNSDGIALRGWDKKELLARNGFHGVTIRDTIRPSYRYESMKKEMQTQLTKEYLAAHPDVSADNIPEEDKRYIEAQAEDSVRAFKSPEAVNNAQSYITFDEWIRRRYADGSISDYADLILMLKKAEEDMRKAEANGEEFDISAYDFAAINAKIQVEKNIYFDHMYDNANHIIYSRQIKNAEFVLIPALLPKDSQLRQLHDTMQKLGIDQINTEETSKASNRETPVYWDNDGNVNANFENDVTTYNAIESYYYKYLYRQQEVPQHFEDTKNKFGLQIQVKIPDNIDLKDDYLRSNYESYQKSYSAKIHATANDLLDKLGFKVEKGGIVSKNGNDVNYKELFLRAKEEMARLGINSQQLEYLEPDLDEVSDGRPKMPEYTNLMSTRLENIFQALFNSAISRQTINGWHGTQVTSVGTSKHLNYHPEGYYNEKTHKYLTKDEYNKLSDEDKKGYEKSNLPYMEIRIPKWSKEFPKNMSDEEILQKLNEALLDEQIAYRIPTEGKQSITIVKIVGFINDVYGSTVIVPDEWVHQSGSDFDVDSIYSMIHKLHYNKKEKKFYKEEYFNPNDYSDGDEREIALENQYYKYIKSKGQDRLDRYRITPQDVDDARIQATLLLQNDEDVNRAIDDYNNATTKSMNNINKIADRYYKVFSKLGYKVKEVDGAKNITENLTGSSTEKAEKLSKINDTLQSLVDSKDINDTDKRVLLNIIKFNSDRINLLNDTVQYLKEQTINTDDNSRKKYTLAHIDVDELVKTKHEILEEKQRSETLKRVEEVAREHGLISFEDFKRLPVEEMNTIEQLDNRIIDNLMNIVKHPSSRQENYTSSNFVDISDNIKYWDAISGREKALSTPYDTASQIRNRNNAQSGAKLKGMSVNMDTFLSKSAMGKFILGKEYDNTFTVIYNLKDADNKITYKSLVEAFGNNVRVLKSDNGVPEVVSVKHNRLGWSLNNKNGEGKIITVYSSETTAHTLDAMKVGSVYNVNDFTFKTFKWFPMLGIDYKTAIGFMYQPGISKLNLEYDKLHSSFLKRSGNEIKNATINIIRDIFGDEVSDIYNHQELVKYVTNNEKTRDILKSILGINQFGKNKTYYDVNKYIDNDLLKLRLQHVKERGNEFEYHFDRDENIDRNSEDFKYSDLELWDACFDLIVLAQYNEMSNMGNYLNEIVKVSKPEKTGASQTVYETRAYIERIRELRGDYENANRTRNENENGVGIVDFRTNEEIKEDERIRKLIINEKGQSFLEALYPINEEGDWSPNDSFYPFICQIFKDCTVTSADINSRIFRLEDDKWYNLRNDIRSKLGRKMRPDEDRQFKKYLVSHFYNELSILRNPLILDEDGNIKISKDVDSDRAYIEEINRVKGYTSTHGEFKVNRKSRPTKEEISEFMKLTPSQKIDAIGRIYTHKMGLFDFLKNQVDSARPNRYNGYSGQRITFDEDRVNIEEMFKMFSDVYDNTNPLIRLTAIDLVKYAFICEGFNFGKGNITKIIPNYILLQSLNEGGMNIIEDTNIKIKDADITRPESLFDGDEFIDKFVRSHPDYCSTIYFDNRYKGKEKTNKVDSLLNRLKSDQGVIFVPKVMSFGGSKEDVINKNTDNYNRLLISLYDKIIGKDGAKSPQERYINISYYKGGQRQKVLYRIYIDAKSNLILIPRPKLDINEYTGFTYNPDNLVREEWMGEISNDYGKAPKLMRTKYLTDAGYKEIKDKLFEPFFDNNSNKSIQDKDIKDIGNALRDAYKKLKDKGTLEAPTSEKQAPRISLSENLFTQIMKPKVINERKAKLNETDKADYDPVLLGGVGRFIEQIKKLIDDGLATKDNGGFIFNSNLKLLDLFSPNDKKFYRQRIKIGENEYYLEIRKIPLHQFEPINWEYIKANDEKFLTKDADEDYGNVSARKIHIQDRLYQVRIAKPGNEIEDIIFTSTKKAKKSKNTTSKKKDSISLDDVMNKPRDISEVSDAELDDIQFSISRVINGVEYDSTVTRSFEENTGIIINTIRKAAYRGDEEAKYFLDKLHETGVNSRLIGNISSNASTFYRLATTYYRHKLAELKNEMKINEDGTGGFLLSSTLRTYNITDAQLYEDLGQDIDILNQSSDYNRLLNLILEVKTFGRNLKTLTYIGKDETINKYISEIQNIISDAELNDINIALDHLFNIYLAKHSYDPLIRQGIMELRTQFGDLGQLDTWLTDVTEMRSQEVQVVTKLINRVIGEAERIHAPRAALKFKQDFRKLLGNSDASDVDFSKIIDKHGYFVKDYSEDYVTQKNKLDDEYNEILNDEINHLNNPWDANDAVYWKKYWDKWLEREQFYIDNTIRKVDTSYYQKRLNNIKAAINQAGDFFYEYMKLEKAKYDNVFNVSSEAESRRRAAIANKMAQLASPSIEEASTMTDEALVKSAALGDFLKARANLNSDYFDERTESGWEADLAVNLRIFNDIRRRYPLMTDDNRRSLDPSYAAASDWIATNTIPRASNNFYTAARNNFGILRGVSLGSNPISIAIKAGINEAGSRELASTFGKLDGRKFSAERMRIIKERQTEQNEKYNTNASVKLIRPVPQGDVLTDEFWKDYKEKAGITATDAERNEAVKKLNEIFSKFVNKNNNLLDTVSLVEYLYENNDDRRTVENLLDVLENIKTDRTDEFKEWFKKNVNFKASPIYDMQLQELEARHSSGSKEDKNIKDLWYYLCGELNQAGDEIVARFSLFGTFEIKESSKDKYVDVKKTKAREFISKNVTFEPNINYWDARAEARRGTIEEYNEWFDANHVYNPITGEYEPLRVWTEMVPKRGGEYENTYNYYPTREFTVRTPKVEYDNEKKGLYKRHSANYNTTTGKYNNPVQANTATKAMKKFLMDTVTSGVSNYKMAQAAEQGFVPRMLKTEFSAGKLAKEFASVFGLIWDTSYKQEQKQISLNYEDHYTENLPMLDMLKAKGYEGEISVRPQNPYETDNDYRKYLRETNEKNKKIREANLEREAAIRDNDWEKVFSEYVKQSTIFAAKEAAKNTLFTLLEELKLNRAYKLNTDNNLSRNVNASLYDSGIYNTEELRNIYKVTANWGLKRIFGDYHEKSVIRSLANNLQQFTSAKFMIANMWSGISNVTMGYTNMEMERWAGDYFTTDDAMRAQVEYFGGTISYLDSWFNPNKDTFSTKADALIHMFNILEYDRLMERKDGEKMSEVMERIRDTAYFNMSGGEHFMQNTILLAVLRGTRVWYDKSVKRNVLVSQQQLRYEYENKAFEEVLRSNETLTTAFKLFRDNVKSNIKDLFDYTRRSKDLAAEFIRAVYNNKVDGIEIPNNDRKTIIDEYNKVRKKYRKMADEKFASLRSVYDQLEFKNGKIEINKRIDGDGKVQTHDGEEGFVDESLIADLANRVVSINKKIHGVYDKDGAALIERKFWGSVIMQYHKHIWPGIMKHWRRMGYFNEYRGTTERGMYTDAISYLKHNIHIFDAYRESRKDGDPFLKNISEAFKAVLNIPTELAIAGKLMPDYKRANLRRNLGEASGMVATLLTFMVVFSLKDNQDEINKDPVAANAIYLADRLMSEIIMFNPYGAVSEAQTLWQNPVASGAFYVDAIKAMTLCFEYMFNPDFNEVYDRGPYKGMNKFEVLARRNFFLTRLALRFKTIGKNNKYYRIGNKGIMEKIAQHIVGFKNRGNDEEFDESIMADSDVQFDYDEDEFNDIVNDDEENNNAD